MSNQTNDNRDRELLEFERLIARNGAQLNSWPEQERVRALALCKTNAAARNLLAEEQALDRLLKAADGPPPDSSRLDQLANRIVATAKGESSGAGLGDARAGSVPANVIALDPAARRKARMAPNRSSANGAVRDQADQPIDRNGFEAPVSQWRFVAALAASLVVGIAIGASGISNTAIENLASAIGWSTGYEVADEAETFPLFDATEQNEGIL